MSLHSTRVPLLPKLRGNFAEFLSESYLAHLSILYLPTFGGLGYGYLLFSMRSFSWQCGYNTFELVSSTRHALLHNAFADFPTKTCYTLAQALPVACVSFLLRPYASDNE